MTVWFTLQLDDKPGSLARVIGPISAALLYFHFGSHLWVYVGAAALMIPAFWVVRQLPDPQPRG